MKKGITCDMGKRNILSLALECAFISYDPASTLGVAGMHNQSRYKNMQNKYME